MSLPSPLERRIVARVRALEDDHLARVLRSPSGIDLSSNDYLGLSRHPELQHRMIEAIEQDGCGSGGSRLLRGHRDIFAEVERSFAAWKGTERSVYFSSGYLANLAVLTTFAEAGDVILADRLNHASLRDGARLSPARRITFKHHGLAALERLLREARGVGQAFVVTESLFSMDGDIPPLREYASLCRDAGALLIIDEAHAVGVFGARGSGLVEECGIESDVFLSINTAGKALGVAGAFVAGPAWAIEYLVQRARPFVYSTAPPPAVAAALAAALGVVAREPERRAKLHDRARRLRARLAEAGVAVVPGESPIIPVLIGDAGRAVAVAGMLQSMGFDVRAIRPPTVPVGTARLRLSANVMLTDEDIDRFAVSLAAALQPTTPCHAGCS